MSLFVSDADLVELTGYSRPKAQRRFLADRGYRFEVRPDGRPRLLVEALRERQLRRSEPARPPGPDLDALG